MLPTATDNGGRLAAIGPTALATIALGTGLDPALALETAFAGLAPSEPVSFDGMPKLKSVILIAVDGLGHANLGARIGHAPTIAGMQRKRIETVAPSTTGAALTTLLTGRLPGSHGLIGYRIKHPRLGLRSVLSEWQGIDDVREWQRATPLFHAAAKLGISSRAIGRPAHADSGLTRANLSGATYLSGQTIADRCAIAAREARSAEPGFIYLYFDELDRAAHAHGWQSEEWCRRLEQLDAALDDLLRTLPGDVGVVLTADHGIVDVASHEQVILEGDTLEGVREVGGEPRLRALYLDDPDRASEIAARIDATESKRAWVGTREEFIATGCFGEVDAEVAERMGHVLIAAKKQVAYYATGDDPASLEMVGQHGSLTEDERGVPLALAGALAGSAFVSQVAKVAAAYVR